MWGGTPDRNMVSEHEGAADRLGHQDEEEHEVGRRPRIAELRQSGRGRRHGVRRHEQRRAARSEAARRSRRADGVPRSRPASFSGSRRTSSSKSGRANDWPYQGVASSPLVEGNRLYYVSNRGVLFCLDIEGFRDKRKRRAGDRREARRPAGRRRHLVVRHDGRGGHLSAQPGEFVAGRRGAIWCSSAPRTDRTRATSTFRRRARRRSSR